LRSPTKKRGVGVASKKAFDAPRLSISPISSLGNGLALKSSRSVASAPLGLDTTPSNEDLISRLTESLTASWVSFVRIFIRKGGNIRSNEEKWLSDYQSRISAMLSRLHNQETSKITTTLPLLIAYEPVLDVSVSHEGGCPGFSTSFLAHHTSSAFNAGVFSPPLDSTQAAAQSVLHASERAKTTFKHLFDIVRYLEGQGTYIVAMYYNDKNELCFYKSEAFDLGSRKVSGAFHNHFVIFYFFLRTISDPKSNTSPLASFACVLVFFLRRSK
jgi:hypothetical protein